ncbi:Conidiation protein 6-domain-containing protein [Cubamyces lactineus]|nr:Conidiation protein 6-domain-containing protein [Cubamyces lactineus]
MLFARITSAFASTRPTVRSVLRTYASSSGNRVAGGFKAALHNPKVSISNPRTSEEAKQHAREILEAVQAAEVPLDATPEEHHKRVIAGYKAALHNPRVSEEAKRHAKDFLRSNDTL